MREQSQWLGISSVLGEALRAQIARLPEMPKHSSQTVKWPTIAFSVCTMKICWNPRARKNYPTATADTEQKSVLDAQLKIQRALLASLISAAIN